MVKYSRNLPVAVGYGVKSKNGVRMKVEDRCGEAELNARVLFTPLSIPE
jgi:hypothetical protein